MPLPTLTAIQTARQSPAGGTKGQQRDALKAAVNLLAGGQGWTAVDAATGNEGTHPGVRIIPPVGSPVTCQIIVGWGDGTTPTTTQMQTPVGSSPPADNVATMLFGGNYAAGNFWYTDNPFGAGVRTSKGWMVAPAWNASADSRWWVVATEEWLAFFCRAGLTDTDIFGGIAGALIEPADAASCEADGRIYGMATGGTGDGPGNFPLRVDMHTAGSNPNEVLFRHDGLNGGQSHAGFFGPASPGAWSGAQTAWQTMATRGMSSAYASGPTSYHTESGKPWPDPITMHRVNVFNVATSKLGTLRSIHYCSDEIARRILRADGADKEIILSGSLTSQFDAYGFRAG